MTARFRVLITDRAWPDCQIERDILRSANAEIVEAPPANAETLCRLVPDCVATMTLSPSLPIRFETESLLSVCTVIKSGIEFRTVPDWVDD